MYFFSPIVLKERRVHKMIFIKILKNLNKNIKMIVILILLYVFIFRDIDIIKELIKMIISIYVVRFFDRNH